MAARSAGNRGSKGMTLRKRITSCCAAPVGGGTGDPEATAAYWRFAMAKKRSLLCAAPLPPLVDPTSVADFRGILEHAAGPVMVSRAATSEFLTFSSPGEFRPSARFPERTSLCPWPGRLTRSGPSGIEPHLLGTAGHREIEAERHREPADVVAAYPSRVECASMSTGAPQMGLVKARFGSSSPSRASFTRPARL